MGSGGSGPGSGGVTAVPGKPSSLLGLPGGDLPIARLHKLTATEFANSVHDLLGAAAPLGPVEVDTTTAGFTSAAASMAVVSPAGVSQYETAIGMATEYAFSDQVRAAALLTCMPSGPTDSACAKQALSALGRRAFRRPLTDDETSRFVTLATTIGARPSNTILTGLRHAVWAILQSPSFLYRVELGTVSAADGGKLKFNDFEMASRLAGALWGSVPDDTLLDAAAQGKLSTADGVHAQAQRMLADARIHRAFAAFVADLYDKVDLDQANKDATLYPTFTSTLRDAMQQELQQRVDDMVFTTKGDYLSLLDSKTTFVNNELAAYYGLPTMPTDGWRKATFPDSPPRVGLLGAGALLAAKGLPSRTSPTERGKFINNTLLCRTIPAPPAMVPPLPDVSDAPNTTVRQRLSTHRSAPACASCHALMDPMGFGMENFDTGGKYRTTDNGQTIDATGELDGVAFNGLGELSSALRKEAVVGPCLVSKVYTYLQGRGINDHDATTLDALATHFASGGNHVNDLLLELVSSDAFRFVEPTKP
jgi:hypothetical protein